MLLLLIVFAWYYTANGIVVTFFFRPRQQRPIWRAWLFAALCRLLWPAVLANEARAVWNLHKRR